MPQGVNLTTVKKDDGTTNVTYTFVQGASGGQPAVWLGPQLGNSIEHQAQMRMTSRDAAKGKSRALRVTWYYPQVTLSSGVYSVTNAFRGSMDIAFPNAIASTDLAEAVSQFLNVLVLTKDGPKAGWAHT